MANALFVTTLSEAEEAADMLEDLTALMPKPKPKPPVFKFKPRNPRRPKHAKN